MTIGLQPSQIVCAAILPPAARAAGPELFRRHRVNGKPPTFVKGVVMSAPFKLAPLPWDEDALAPTISAKTISFHYHKHHQTYVDTLNRLVAGGKFADMKLEKIVQATAASQDEKEKKIFNNAAQVWNHDFYWRSLTPTKTEASGKLASAIARDF